MIEVASRVSVLAVQEDLFIGHSHSQHIPEQSTPQRIPQQASHLWKNMTNLAENTVTDQEKKLIKGFYELFCQYLQEQELEPGAFTLEFTFFLETFYPHDPKCHQVILD